MTIHYIKNETPLKNQLQTIAVSLQAEWAALTEDDIGAQGPPRIDCTDENNQLPFTVYDCDEWVSQGFSEGVWFAVELWAYPEGLYRASSHTDAEALARDINVTIDQFAKNILPGIVQALVGEQAQ